MDSLRVEKSVLKDGVVKIHGYKHSMVQIIAASVAFNLPVCIKNVPLVDDTYVLQEIINLSGGTVILKDRQLSIDPTNINKPDIDDFLSKKIHGSLYLLPAYAVRLGRAIYHGSGGCQIGSLEENQTRPINHILNVMNKFGIQTKIQTSIDACVEHSVEKVILDIMNYSDSQQKLTSPNISGATKTALLCSFLAKEVLIQNPYLKTDVQDLTRFLSLSGYEVQLTSNSIRVKQAEKINRKSIDFYLTECVSEVMTYITFALFYELNLDLEVENIEGIQRGLRLEFEFLRKMGANIGFETNRILIRKSTLKSIDIDVTNDSIQSDHHPFFALLLLKGDRRSCIREFVWKDRFGYVSELQKLGAKLTKVGNCLYIDPSELNEEYSQPLNATDTRAAALLLLASLSTQSSIEIQNIQHLHRGYEDIIPVLESLGANIKQNILVGV